MQGSPRFLSQSLCSPPQQQHMMLATSNSRAALLPPPACARPLRRQQAGILQLSQTGFLRAARVRRPLALHTAATAQAEELKESSNEATATSSGENHHHHVPSPDDVVIVGAVRTAATRAKKGGFKDTPADDMVAAVLKDLLTRTGVKPEEVGDVCFGSVFPQVSSQRAVEVRTAMFLAGFPPEVPIYTVNRQCAAGVQSIVNVAASIRAGYIDVGIAGGVEHMTSNPLIWDGSKNPRAQDNKEAKDVLLPLGITAENVAEVFHVSRDDMDKVAAASHAKAAAARAAGKFKQEIVPVKTKWIDPNTGEAKEVSVDEDDGIRPETTPESLAKLKPVFKKGGLVSVGNSCQNMDAAAAVMLMKRKDAKRRGLPVMATMRSFAVVGVPPAVMGIAPTIAIPKALDKAGLSSDDIDVYEINEAFGSQASYIVTKLGLDPKKVNPNGGAIALGHPAGCTGARQTVTLLHEMARRGNGARYGVVSMCTGAGMGAAAVFERDAMPEQVQG